jgi:phosphatidylglycerophosphate synthase
MPKDFQQYLPILVIVVLIGFRLFRAAQARKINPGRLWIGPLIMLVGMVAMFALLPIPLANPFAIPIFAAGALIGAGAGYLRGKHQEFSVDPATGDVMSKASPIGTMIFLAIFLARFGLRSWMGNPEPGGGQPMSPNLLLYTDAMLFFAFGMVVTTAWEVWRRTRPLVLAHRATQVLPPL